MPSLSEIQRALADAVLSNGTADFVAGSPAHAREHIAIYRRTVFANYRKALGASYPVVKRLTGAAFFHAAVDAFVVARPSRSGDLNVYGDDFGDFLAAYPPASELPYLADVARLEWSIDEAQRAGDSSCVPEDVLEALAAVSPERLPSLRLALDPSCRLLESRHPIFRIWQTNQTGYADDDRVSLDEGGDRLLVRRGADGVSIERLDRGDYAWLAALRAGRTLGAAIESAPRADPAFDLATTLRTHIATGTLVAVVDR